MMGMSIVFNRGMPVACRPHASKTDSAVCLSQVTAGPQVLTGSASDHLDRDMPIDMLTGQ